MTELYYFNAYKIVLLFGGLFEIFCNLNAYVIIIALIKLCRLYGVLVLTRLIVI